MNNQKMLQDVYKDFFGTDISLVKEDKTILEENLSIDDLRIDENSKELLNKIITYMAKYKNGDESNYINFCISLNTKDESLVADVSKILSFYSNKYSYTDKSNATLYSMYKLDKPENIVSYYKESGVVVLSDLKALDLNDVSFKLKFFHSFKEELLGKKITIIAGDSIDSFLLNDKDLKNYFMFKLVEDKYDVNDVYNSILDKLNLSDDMKVLMLDYVSKTFDASDIDFSSYVNSIVKYVSFNGTLPVLNDDKSVEDIFKDLNELVGLSNVKTTLNDLVNLISFKKKTKDEVKINDVNLHMVFLGNPGTGKTTVARMVANILYDLKYIKQNKLIEVSSKDLVAEYVGQTAVKTMNVVEKALGGVLFVDEAYALRDVNGDNSFNGEAIATLIKAMEDYRDNLVVIFAGYTKEMQDFLDSNSGIVSRIGYTLTFEDYSVSELKQIFMGMVKKSGFLIDDNAVVKLEEIINKNINTKNFGNARFVRNIFEKSVIKHASNTKDNKNKKMLKTLTDKDIVDV